MLFEGNKISNDIGDYKIKKPIRRITTMERIQFYSSEKLNEALRKESERKGVKVSVIVTDICIGIGNKFR